MSIHESRIRKHTERTKLYAKERRQTYYLLLATLPPSILVIAAILLDLCVSDWGLLKYLGWMYAFGLPMLILLDLISAPHTLKLSWFTLSQIWCGYMLIDSNSMLAAFAPLAITLIIAILQLPKIVAQLKEVADAEKTRTPPNN